MWNYNQNVTLTAKLVRGMQAKMFYTKNSECYLPFLLGPVMVGALTNDFVAII